jgi:hypothetical protein
MKIGIQCGILTNAIFIADCTKGRHLVTCAKYIQQDLPLDHAGNSEVQKFIFIHNLTANFLSAVIENTKTASAIIIHFSALLFNSRIL